MSTMWDILPGHPAHLPATPEPAAAPPRRSHLPTPDGRSVPKSLAALWAIVEEKKGLACPEILELVLRIRKWLKCGRERIAMNRTFSLWYRRSPCKIIAMATWLDRPDIADHFADRSARWALDELRDGLARVAQGETADEAFGHLVGEGGERGD